VKLGQAISQVATTGTTAQVEKAVDVVDDARRRLFAILAEE
jgi:DNA-binding protein